MTTVKILEHLQTWFAENVCSHIKLKKPPEDGVADGGEYPYELVNPACFAHSIPSFEKLPNGLDYNTPCLILQIVKGKDNLTDMQGNLTIQASFSVWNTGEHARDYIVKQPQKTHFSITEDDGWRDLLNFLDIARIALKDVINFGIDGIGDNIILDRTSDVEFGYFTDKGVTISYPMYAAYITFNINYKIIGDNGCKNYLYN